MFKQVSFYDFEDSFSWGYKDNFSYEGKRALFDYIETLEEDIGTPIELDTVALCSEYAEWSSLCEAAQNYFVFEGMTFWEDGWELKTVEQVENEAKEFLQDRTQLIEFEWGVIIQNF